MNNDLTDRIARAIDDALPQRVMLGGQSLKFVAEAALSAMHGEVGEPTEAMIDLAERAIEEWLTTHDGEEIDCRALARLAVMQGEVGGLREALTDWLNAFKADPFSTGADKVDRLLEVITASPPVDQGRIERLEDLLDTERYKVAIGVQAIARAVQGRQWLSQPGRGSYAYDDERYQQEFGAALTEIEAALKPLQAIAQDWSDCPRDPLRVAANRSAALTNKGANP